ncbi:alcohol dehydrogenase class IV [Propionibacteriaceae bacterium ES.041]|uniref:hydroxyacid-oxoacid transhydrogenase n=1 Tax=Enemella evansiae TaxID=2016499 RepID=UPI000B9787B5|nr:hydroxyacid-oxoacid transhydrogenase [Enemella evansiae]OYO11438.1 alcohol dehydrogenase [Enemella evansiae]PFG66329.1 alcohol dehydrogenase class IV [Propionibacteriaceae bacterium ES.041]TDO88078.1 alcohol dehydrogenase class IV [Enemella evansiae]
MSEQQIHEETIFTWGAPPLKFGAGAVDEIGFDLSQYDVGRVLIITDAGVAATGIADRVQECLTRYDIKSEIYAESHVEPTDESFERAIAYAKENGPFDGFVALGGGSSIDTAKAVNLLTTYPGELMDYVNKPIGRAQTPPGPLKPLIAIPTTAGTGAESTAVCIMDILSMKVKSGLSHWRLRPTMAVIDPLVTLDLPPMVSAASGMDILCHAAESYTAKPYTQGPRKKPEERVTYCGANPVSDLWSERAMQLLASSFRTAVHHGDDVNARNEMMMAATFAGMGFGNAGVHIPHANAYPIAGMVRDYTPPDYPQDEPMVPHGMAVSLTAPEAFRFSFEAAPERHLRVAELLNPDAPKQQDPAEQLPSVLIELMADIGIPNGIGAVGYTEDDVADLAAGTMKQQRLLTTCARTPTEEDIRGILSRSISNW